MHTELHVYRVTCIQQITLYLSLTTHTMYNTGSILHMIGGVATVGPGRACTLPIIFLRAPPHIVYVSSRSRSRLFSLLPGVDRTQQCCLLSRMHQKRSQNSKFFWENNSPPLGMLCVRDHAKFACPYATCMSCPTIDHLLAMPLI